ncbi:Signal recognition particle 54 kDa protein (SRP54) [Durusdinium trenchii]|uniref:Signal recognition particle 54 kDa protein n=1 Tax=Durusdinium trenchii TaxID=1381693 RepID=A0ABP0RHP9_9DINO
MVLQELGSKINSALSKLNTATVIDEETIDEVLKEIAKALLSSDVNVRVVAEVRNNIRKEVLSEAAAGGATNKTRQIRNAVFSELVRLLSPSKEPFTPKRGRCNVFMFVGLQGSGKTTTIAKFANYWARKGWKTAMVCCDTFRAGALDQIKQNAIKLHIPYYGNPLEADPVKLAEEGTEHFRAEKYEIILVDTSGRHHQESELFEEMEQVQGVVQPDEVIFVMDSTIGQAVAEQAAAFKASVPVGSVIITKLDGHARGGGALSAVAATDAPITFIGTGEHFDEFEKFDANSFVSRLMGMGDVKGLMEKLKDTKALEKAPEMMERMQKGQFTLRDLRQQFQTVMGMGNLGQVMSMIPGMSQMMQGQDSDQATKRIQAFMTCFDSMTEDELDCIFKVRKPDPSKPGEYITTFEKTLSESRMRRIAKGAGVPLEGVLALMQSHKQFEGMVQKMGKSGLMNEKQMQQNMKRNPGALMEQLQKSMDPRMLQQMGGTGNLMNLMKQMDMGAMGDMMKQMGGMGLPGMGGGGGGRGGPKRR